MKQLDLFTPEQPQYPYRRKPNKTELLTIVEAFGAEYVDPISLFLNDILQLQPFQNNFVRNGANQRLRAIGASCRQDHYFYCLEPSTGNIYLEHNFSLFPVK